MTSRTQAARSALAARDFEGVLMFLADEEPTDEVLALRADAEYGAGRFEAALHDRETLYTRQLDQGRPDDAAATAATIALHLMADTGLMSAVRGWVARSRRLLREIDSPVGAVLSVASTYERLLCGDHVAAAEHAERSVEFGERHDVPIARFLGQIALARLAAAEGRVAAGVAVLDDVAVELMSGGYDAFVIGNLYCELVCAAQALMLLDRAREWTEVVAQWLPGAGFGGMHGRCRVHRAELLRVSGPAEAAEQEALAACDELRPWMRREFGWPLVELGNARLRSGDLTGAEEAYRRAYDHAWSPLPGYALLRMEQGDLVAAAELLAAEIAHPTVLPWKERPPIAELQLIPLLEAQVQVAEAAGDDRVAASAAEHLQRIADRFETPGICAGADLASARAALAAGDSAGAVAAASRSVVAWLDLDAPYDAAMARTVLGRAHQRAGNRAQAEIDLSCARDAFLAYGAQRRVAEVDALLAGRGDPAPSVATAVLQRDGDGWRVGHNGHETVLADLTGLRLLHRLVTSPTKSFHVLDLAGAQSISPGLPVLDDEAKAVYRHRLAEVEDDIAEAEANHDLARAELAGRDREYLLAELRHAVGFDGRDRRTGGTVERARTSITRTLRYAIGRIGEELPELGEHLGSAVHTGVECSYSPDPLSRIRWRIDDR